MPYGTLVAIQFMEEAVRRREIMASPIHDASASIHLYPIAPSGWGSQLSEAYIVGTGVLDGLQKTSNNRRGRRPRRPAKNIKSLYHRRGGYHPPAKKSKDKKDKKPSIFALFVMINELMLTHHELALP